MSVNKYNASTGELTNIASGQRTWVGTQAAYKSAKDAGTLPNNAIIAITDDEQDHNHYSTEETETGMYWIDGRPIYRKVIEITGTGAQSYQVAHNIENLDYVTCWTGVSTSNNTAPGYIRLWSFTNTNYRSSVTVTNSLDSNSNSVYVALDSTIASQIAKIYLTLEYVKTTD